MSNFRITPLTVGAVILFLTVGLLTVISSSAVGDSPSPNIESVQTITARTYRTNLSSADSGAYTSGVPLCDYVQSYNARKCDFLIFTADSTVTAVFQPWVSSLEGDGTWSDFVKGDTIQITGNTGIVVDGMGGNVKLGVVSITGGASSSSDSITKILYRY